MSDHEHLASALAAAQGEMTVANRDGRSHHGQFATLDSVLSAVRGPLANHGIAIVQEPSYGEGIVHVVTRLMWRDQQVQCDISAKPTKMDVQGIGSTITYLRRYGLMAMAGIAPGDDDDGNAAVSREPSPRPQQRPQRPQPAPERTEAPKPPQRRAEYLAGADGRIHYQATLKEMQLDPEAVKAYCIQGGAPLPRDRTTEQLTGLLAHLATPGVRAQIGGAE